MAGDRERLKRALAKELGWDLGTLDGIVEALQAANGQSEVEEIVQDYLGGSTAVKGIVQTFLGTGRPAQPAQSAQAVGAAPLPRSLVVSTLVCSRLVGGACTMSSPRCLPVISGCLRLQGTGASQGRQGALTRQVRCTAAHCR